jgi:hypothetical protein
MGALVTTRAYLFSLDLHHSILFVQAVSNCEQCATSGRHAGWLALGHLFCACHWWPVSVVNYLMRTEACNVLVRQLEQAGMDAIGVQFCAPQLNLDLPGGCIDDYLTSI